MAHGESDSELVEFLILAKRNAYASGGAGSRSAVDPVFQDSHQLEFRSGDWLYRDIYFGEAFFVGQEIVYVGRKAVWSMCYAGGWTAGLSDPGEAGVLGGFLQSALQVIPQEFPFRGPLEYREDGILYQNFPKGDIEWFVGIEKIKKENLVVYELNYSGGRLS